MAAQDKAHRGRVSRRGNHVHEAGDPGRRAQADGKIEDLLTDLDHAFDIQSGPDLFSVR